MHFNHKIRARYYFWIAGFFALLLSAGCVGTPQALAPASSNAQDITGLILTVFEIAAVVFVVVEALLIYTVIRFSRRKIDGLPNQTEGNRRLEIAWTMAPVIVLGIVFVVSLKTLTTVGYQPKTVQAASNTQSINIRVVGHQWWWEFDYPDQKIITADEMHVPVNATVYLDVESVDVIHSYWVPQLGGKMDAIPGHTNKTWLQPTQTGTFTGQCSEFCGSQHGNMRFTVVVDTPEQFQAWLKQQEAAAPTLTGQAAQGEQAFLNGACVGCHTIDGTKAQGKIGPNLTHFGSRGVFAGATLTNTPDNVAKWLADPQAVKPGNLMPNLHLATDQINSLVAFLESLK